jgi:WhiB family transcriptional regulator, redox-sensing transcriptional regulator
MVAVELPPEPTGPAYDPEALAFAIGVIVSGLNRAEPWRLDALCREYPDVDFFPGRGEPTMEARRVCSRCLVRAECREFASAQPTTLAGVWAGSSGLERKKTRARAQSAASPRKVREKSENAETRREPSVTVSAGQGLFLAR